MRKYRLKYVDTYPDLSRDYYLNSEEEVFNTLANDMLEELECQAHDGYLEEFPKASTLIQAIKSHNLNTLLQSANDYYRDAGYYYTLDVYEEIEVESDDLGWEDIMARVTKLENMTKSSE